LKIKALFGFIPKDISIWRRRDSNQGMCWVNPAQHLNAIRDVGDKHQARKHLGAGLPPAKIAFHFFVHTNIFLSACYQESYTKSNWLNAIFGLVGSMDRTTQFSLCM